jgi:hypothetical protein
MTVDTENPSLDAEGYYESGLVAGILLSRYIALRSSGPTDPVFTAPVPSEIPEVIRTLLTCMSRVSVNSRLFETGWHSLDRLLLSESPEELRIALRDTSDARLQ